MDDSLFLNEQILYKMSAKSMIMQYLPNITELYLAPTNSWQENVIFVPSIVQIIVFRNRPYNVVLIIFFFEILGRIF